MFVSVFFNGIGVELETGEAFLFLVGGGPKPLKSRVISTTVPHVMFSSCMFYSCIYNIDIMC